MKEQGKKGTRKSLNVGLVVLSLLISIGLWAYVVVINDPEQTTTIGNIPVTYLGEDLVFKARELVLTNRHRGVTLTFRGRMSDLTQLSKDNVKVIVDLSSVDQAGEYSLGYEIELPSAQNGKVEPTRHIYYIPVQVDHMESKTVEFRFTGEIVAADGYKRGMPKLTPAMLRVTGPAKVLETIDCAEVILDNTKPISTTLSLELDFSLRDTSGNKVVSELVTTDVEKLNAEFPVSKLKVVPVSLEIEEGGGLTEKNVNITYSHNEITVAGGADVLDMFNQCVLGTIRLADIMESTEMSFDVPLENGMELVSGIATIKVSIELVNVSYKTLELVPMAKNEVSRPGYKLDFLTKQISVNLRGSQEALSQLTAANVYAIVDLSNTTLQPDAPMDFPVTITLPSDLLNAGVLGTYVATVELVLEDDEEA